MSRSVSVNCTSVDPSCYYHSILHCSICILFLHSLHSASPSALNEYDLKILIALSLGLGGQHTSHVMRRTQNSPNFKKRKRKKKREKKKRTSPSDHPEEPPPKTAFLLAWVQHFLPQGFPEDAFKKFWELLWSVLRPEPCGRHAALAVRVFLFFSFFLASALRVRVGHRAVCLRP